MKYNPNKIYFSFPFFRRFMGKWYNEECYFHDVAYDCGGSEFKRWLSDLSLSWSIISKPNPPIVRIGGFFIGIFCLPILLCFGWYKWYKIKLFT